ncbi:MULTISPECIES: hypothetical protein [unclassified Lysinibacillus]
MSLLSKNSFPKTKKEPSLILTKGPFLVSKRLTASSIFVVADASFFTTD